MTAADVTFIAFAESKESIGFSVGMNCSAQIYSEDDAVRFLYSYNNKSLSDIMDSEIRARVEADFVEACAKHTMNDILAKKAEIMEYVSKDGKTKTKVAGADGAAVFKWLTTGTWTVTITDGTDTASETVSIDTDYTKEMSFVKIYGIYRDITASSPAWAREDDAVGKTAKASVGTTAGVSDFDNCYPWSGIQRETPSTGDVMVKIPKFWFRRYRDGNIEHIKIADKATDGFDLHPAFNHAGVEKDYLYVGA